MIRQAELEYYLDKLVKATWNAANLYPQRNDIVKKEEYNKYMNIIKSTKYTLEKYIFNGIIKRKEYNV